MRSALLCGLALVASTTLLAEAPAEDAARTFAATGARTAAVRSYTSALHVDFALRSFPYLSFHVKGQTAFARPDLYSVHFDHVPGFAHGFENIKADPLEPQTWPEHYDIHSVTRVGDRTMVEMTDKVAGNVKGVHAELDANGLRRIVWTYTNGGVIDVAIVPTLIDGVPVPQTEDADIKLPAYHVHAHATFDDYKIVQDGSAH